MDNEVLDLYETSIQNLARFVRPDAATVDHRGRDRSDYVSLFRMTALHAHQRLPDTGYVWQSLKNAAYQAHRQPKSCEFVSLEEEGVVEPAARYSVVGRLEARDIVEKLRARLSAADMEILEAVMVNGMAHGAWRHAAPVPGRGFRRVQAALRRARAVLAGLSIYGP